jgi:hypothetical protein
MSNNQVIASGEYTRVVAASQPGLYASWGPQAWIDMWMSNTMLVKKAMPIISHTFLPILRLSCNDTEKLEAEYEAIKSQREAIHWSDSPREKWRKRYGNFVREIEWALLELRKYFSRGQFEDIVIGTSVKLSRETSSDFLEMMNRMSEKHQTSNSPVHQGRPSLEPKKPGRWTTFMFKTFNPAHWLTGPATITEYDPGNGVTVMEIPDCAWHTCARQETLPNPNALPEEGCLHICKGPFEVLFNGDGGALRMEFEPHLPETSCTVRMTWEARD